jgi:FlaA1/EpsC-like NDP-sugar epimerase
VRQVARFAPSKILLVERAEFALFDIDGELRRTRPDVEIVPLVADVCDEARMRMVLSEQTPQIVFHAAAHKHVPLMEANPGEAIKNNILGTRLLGELSAEHGVETFVMISTDKAVGPTSIMGATKRFASCRQDRRELPSTRYVAVASGTRRVGGSAVPIFREQIRPEGW